jgi:class 3 adenylate cyclase
MPRDKENLFQSMSRFIESGIDPMMKHEEIWHRYGETVAALILDSSGFSRVTESHGIIHFLSRLMLLRNICKPIFEAHNCKRLHFEADNAFAIFDSVEDAIESALQVHSALYEAKLMLTEEERFRVGIGIGYGKMLYSETLEGYFSEEMNFASKLGEDLADGDETLISDSAYQQADKQLTGEFSPRETQISGISLKHYRHTFSPKS